MRAVSKVSLGSIRMESVYGIPRALRWELQYRKWSRVDIELMSR
jgi:hypothetical protein